MANSLILHDSRGPEGVTLTLEGRIDTVTAGALETALEQLGGEPADLVLDFSGVDYLSSAGLRVLLLEQKRHNRQGTKMVLCGVTEPVREIFEITGFLDILTIR